MKWLTFGFIGVLLLIMSSCSSESPSVDVCDEYRIDFDAYIDNSCQVADDCSYIPGVGSCSYELVGSGSNFDELDSIRSSFFDECSLGIACAIEKPTEVVFGCVNNVCTFKSFSDLDRVDECIGINVDECIDYMYSTLESSFDCHFIEDEPSIDCLLSFVETEGCEILPVDTEQRDFCFMGEAISTNDRELCYYSGELLSECFSKFAIELLDSTICEEIYSSQARSNCYYSYAIELRDSSLCDEKYIGNLVRSCLARTES
ncbi:MAG: hypothetical protein ACMXYE_01860 [Candidatus Woesearchaeota archaeon]